MSIIRLDKYLADCGIGTRSQVKKILKNGLVTINDIKVSKAETKVNTESDKVMVGHDNIIYKKYEYYMLNKPSGYVSARTDNLYPTVLSLLDGAKHKELSPVGRLDVDTEGLLLITNDGQTTHNLLAPNKHVDKTYYVELDMPIPDLLIEEFKKGIDIGENKLTKPAKLKILDNKATCELTISEGKFHQVKRMFAHFGLKVIYLKRLSMGNIKLDANLKIGEYRALTDEEIDALLKN